MLTAIPRNLPSEEMVIALINRDNDLFLSHSDVVISDVRINPTPTEIRNTGFMRDTAATVKAVFGGNFKENTDITYRRIDADTVFGKTVAVIPPKGQGSTYDLIPDLNAMYGLALQNSDIENEIINLRTLPVTVNVKFLADCPAWIGEIPVVIRRIPVDLANVVLNNELPAQRYPTGQTDLIQGDLYTYSRDFNQYSDTLVDVGLNTPLDDVMTILNVVFTPDVWVIRASPAPFNLNNATIVYNGPVTLPYSSRRGFNRVLVISLDKTCTNMVGRLILHYNA